MLPVWRRRRRFAAVAFKAGPVAFRVGTFAFFGGGAAQVCGRFAPAKLLE
jgi:hypothetical protein